jgi:RNA-directed DNA polymerase
VISLFQTAGYFSDVSYLLAKLCTLDDALPQGAPTSPAIANAIARPLDFRLAGLAKTFGLRYSRYADDIVLSGDRISSGLSEIVTQIVNTEGFAVNERKTMLARNAQRLIVTGVALSAGRTRLPRAKRRALRASVHRALSLVPQKAQAFESPLDAQLLQRLTGSLAHWINVEPSSEYAREARRAIRQLQTEISVQLASRSSP